MPTFEHAYKVISQLAHDFKLHERQYLAPGYSEAQVRKDYIDKFFTGLGWDVNHDVQKDPYAQEVKVEKAAEGAGMQGKRADYSFAVAPKYGEVKFYVEAKKPRLNLSDPDFYFQTIRYGWNAKTPFAVLTDFEEFHILDCRYPPKIDTVLGGLVERFHYLDYLDEEKFRRIYHLFSREAVADGALERRADELKKKKGKESQKAFYSKGVKAVDDAFLEELDSVRLELATAFKKTNPSLGSEELTDITQRTIDRIVFIRFLEDKLIEPESIIDRLGDRKSAWEDFMVQCKALAAKYNGIVFKESLIDRKGFNHPDERKFGDVIDQFTHKDSPYDFNIIPIHILGSIYERFLGKVVVATAKQARVEEKPEVRKAGGVYYTPQYIVDYIVANTVGIIIDGKSPAELAKMRFADIACGSGSFLITVFDTVLKYHGTWYNDHPIVAKKDGCVEFEGRWILSLKQKKAILLNNIYGVDIDHQAVEVTQLSLYLKLLEDETTATANEMMVLFKEKLLPDLAGNIVCGNSLVASDGLFDRTDERKINAMDFRDAFPKVMREGGFDAIVGNPPYVRQELIGPLKSYFQQHYAVYHGVADLYTYFIEKGVTLLKPNGLFGIIVANKWMRANYGVPLRHWLKVQCIEEILDFGPLRVFGAATTYTCILRVRNAPPYGKFTVSQIATLAFDSLDSYAKAHSYTVSQQQLEDGGWSLAENRSQALLAKLRHLGMPLQEYVGGKIYRGVLTGLNEAFVINDSTKDRLIDEDTNSRDLIKPFLVGKDIRRYETPRSDKYVIFTRRGTDITKYPAIERHLHAWKARLMPKPKHWKGHWEGRKPGNYKWYEIQDTVEYYPEFEKTKILWPGISSTVTAFALDQSHYYGNDNNQLIISSDLYLLGILNSRLSRFILKNICDKVQGGFYRLKISYIALLPIVVIDSNDGPMIKSSEQLVRLVGEIIEAKAILANVRTDRDIDFYTKKVASLDRKIDELVYALYGLTDEEIQVMEGED